MIVPPYMLDTNIISDLICNPADKVAKHVTRIRDQGSVVSIITAAELRYGSAKAGSPRLLKRIEEILFRICPFPFDVPADSQYGGIRAELEELASQSAPMIFDCGACFSFGRYLDSS